MFIDGKKKKNRLLIFSLRKLSEVLNEFVLTINANLNRIRNNAVTITLIASFCLILLRKTMQNKM